MQGGLFSMLCFCIAVCFLVLKPLKEKYPEVTPKCIADDAHAPTVVYKPADVKRAAQWCHEYVALSKQELNLSANARKFKILQSQEWQGTEGPRTGVLGGTMIVRTRPSVHGNSLPEAFPNSKLLTKGRYELSSVRSSSTYP